MSTMRVVCYENAKRGVYKYSLIKKPEENETSVLQRFIKQRKIDLDVKVEVKEVTLPERGGVSSLTTSFEEHEIIALLETKNGVTIYSGHPVIEHDISGFLGWICHEKRVPLDEISSMSFYTDGLTETIEISPYAWAGADVALLAIEEK